MHPKTGDKFLCGRVSLGGFPPRLPTDPDVLNYSIRLFGSWIRYDPVDGMDNPRRRERVSLQQRREFRPVQIRTL
jgi:hypothetical protein